MKSKACFPKHCPPDILLEIFGHFLSPQDAFKKRHMQLTALRAVCQYWDTVITSTPQYWSSIYIHFPNQVIPLSIIHDWLSRSSDTSLKISMKDRPPINWTNADIQLRTELLSIVDSHVSRCRALQLEITVGILPGLRVLRIHQAEHLEYFEIDMRGNIDEDVHSCMLQQLTSLPSLRHLSITTYFPFLIPQLLRYSDPSWLDRLITVKISCPTTTPEMAELMRKCTSANHISLSPAFRQISITQTISSAVPETTLPHLHSLNISLGSTVCHSLFHQILFPNLKFLQISGLDVSDLSSITLRFTPTLRYLRAKITTERDNIHEVFTLLNHPSVLRLSMLEIESRDYESWTEYGGWNVVDERPVHQAVEEFNRLHGGFRVIRYKTLSEWYRGYLISWVDHKEDTRRFLLNWSGMLSA